MNATEILISPEKPTETKPKRKFLFVCTGNTCRSPMAAALYNYLYGDSESCADSAGIAADGSPISELAALTLAERGVTVTPDNDYPRHISHNVTEDDIVGADAVIGMSAAHTTSLVMRFPAYATKITVMSSDITDPYGGDASDYRECLASIEKALYSAFGKPSGEKNGNL